MGKDTKRQIFVLLLAAGSGKRMKSKEKKQFLNLQNTPLFIWSIRTFLSLTEQYSIHLYLTYSQEDLSYFNELLSIHLDSSASCNISLIPGGKERYNSVYNGICGIKKKSQDSDFILIHDTARPFIQKVDILKIIKALHNFPAVTLGYTIADTIKKIDSNTLQVTEHLKREYLRGILTPQGFHISTLWDAYEKFLSSPYPITDDTEIVGNLGHPIHIIEGSKNNLKITTKEDLIFAKAISEFLEKN